MEEIKTPVTDAPLIPQTPKSPVVSIGDWILTIFIASIPIVNIIMLIIWAFSSSTNPTKANWAKAMLIWAVIGIVLYILFFSAIMGAMTMFTQ